MRIGPEPAVIRSRGAEDTYYRGIAHGIEPRVAFSTIINYSGSMKSIVKMNSSHGLLLIK